MHSTKPAPRRITSTNIARVPAGMSIAQYVDLVDQLLEEQQLVPDRKKPPQPAR